MTYSRPSRRFTTKISAKLKTKVHQNINGILPLWSFFFNKNHVCIWCTLLLLQKLYLMVTYNFAKMGYKSSNSCGINYCFNALKPGPWFNIKSHLTSIENPTVEVRWQQDHLISRMGIPVLLTHWGWDKMDVISQTTLSNAFLWMKMLEFWLKFHWSLLRRVQLTIFQQWFR